LREKRNNYHFDLVIFTVDTQKNHHFRVISTGFGLVIENSFKKNIRVLGSVDRDELKFLSFDIDKVRKRDFADFTIKLFPIEAGSVSVTLLLNLAADPVL